MLPAVTKTFSPVDHMIALKKKKNVEPEETRDKPMKITLWMLMQLKAQHYKTFISLMKRVPQGHLNTA